MPLRRLHFVAAVALAAILAGTGCDRTPPPFDTTGVPRNATDVIHINLARTLARVTGGDSGTLARLTAITKSQNGALFSNAGVARPTDISSITQFSLRAPNASRETTILIVRANLTPTAFNASKAVTGAKRAFTVGNTPTVTFHDDDDGTLTALPARGTLVIIHYPLLRIADKDDKNGRLRSAPSELAAIEFSTKQVVLALEKPSRAHTPPAALTALAKDTAGNDPLFFLALEKQKPNAAAGVTNNTAHLLPTLPDGTTLPDPETLLAVAGGNEQRTRLALRAVFANPADAATAQKRILAERARAHATLGAVAADSALAPLAKDARRLIDTVKCDAAGTTVNVTIETTNADLRALVANALHLFPTPPPAPLPASP